MSNYPDDIRSHKCLGCNNIVPECTCDDEYEKLLHGDDDTYFEIFNSMDSDEVVKLLRDLHRNPSEETTKLLVAQLDLMLANYVKS